MHGPTLLCLRLTRATALGRTSGMGFVPKNGHVLCLSSENYGPACVEMSALTLCRCHPFFVPGYVCVSVCLADIALSGLRSSLHGYETERKWQSHQKLAQ